ncbi:MAG: hypothetical protein Nk1A_7870 [Endomicrobiia bacterium]|nr:MAG: hypothetical protein Nk1A_7870 [Endomicrobiia bacterium]
MSALGGAIGGATFTGIDKLERGVFWTHNKVDKETRE